VSTFREAARLEAFNRGRDFTESLSICCNLFGAHFS
jgi:hypothetical protein